jgi:hypothetical protein
MPGRYQKHADYLDSLEEGALPSQTAKDKQAKSTAEFIHSLRSQGRHKRGMDDRIIASLNRHFLFLEDHPDDPNKWRIPPERVHWRDADYVMDLNSRPYHIPPRKNDPTLSLLGRATANMLSSLRDNGRLKSGMGQDLIEAIEHHGYLLVDHPRDPARWKAVRAEQEYEYDLEPAPLLQEQSHAAGQDYVSAQQSLDQTPLPATGKVEYPQEQQPLGSQSNPQSHYAPQSYYIEPPAQQPLGSQSNPQSHYAPQSL